MPKQILARLVGTSLLSLAGTASALAHATLETAEAPANSSYKAVVRIGHGCEGKPTQAVRVKVPEGVIVAKPMPKAGWQLATTKSAYARSYDYYGTPVAEGVTEIAWTGGDLPDDWYDEFVFRARLADFPQARWSTFRWYRNAPTGPCIAGSRSPRPASRPTTTKNQRQASPSSPCRRTKAFG